MKFLTFNIAVLGALFFLYQAGSGGSAPSNEPAPEPARQAESSAQESTVVHALADQVAVLARSVARLEGHVSEVIQRDQTAGAVASAQAPPGKEVRPVKKAQPEKRVQTARRAQPAAEPAPETPLQSAEASPRKPRPEAPKRPAAAPAQATASYASAAGTAEVQPAPAAETGGSEFSAQPKVASRGPGSEWSDGRATGDPVRSKAGTIGTQAVASANADEPVIEGELMTPSQRRHALLELAQDMELHYLASAGE